MNALMSFHADLFFCPKGMTNYTRLFITSVKCTLHHVSLYSRLKLGYYPDLHWTSRKLTPTMDNPGTSTPAQSVAETLITTRRSILLIGSPMCTAFSRLQEVNYAKMDPAEVERRLAHGRRHLEWTVHLYRLQMAMGLYFLHEHPDGASSWNEPGMAYLANSSGVHRVTGDMCRWGMTQYDDNGPGLIKKPTGSLTNST